MAFFKKWRGISSTQPTAALKRLYERTSASGGDGKEKPCLIKTTYRKGVEMATDSTDYVMKVMKNDPKWLLFGNSVALSMNVVGVIGNFLTIHSMYDWLTGKYKKERQEREKDLKAFKDRMLKSSEEEKEEIMALSNKKFEELKEEWRNWRKEVEEKIMNALAGMAPPPPPVPPPGLLIAGRSVCIPAAPEKIIRPYKAYVWFESSIL